MFLAGLLLLLMSCGGQKSVSERFIEYYEEVAAIVEDNKDDPEKAVDALEKFLAKNKEDYISVTNGVNNYTDQEKEQFVKDFGQRLSDAFEKYWENAFTPAGQSEEIASLMEQIPMLDIMALNKFFPQEE